jgi:hypothetical protein
VFKVVTAVRVEAAPAVHHLAAILVPGRPLFLGFYWRQIGEEKKKARIGRAFSEII